MGTSWYTFTSPTLGSLFRHLLRAICTVLLDPRDPLLHSERTQGFTADPDYWKGEVFVNVGRNQNLKDLKETMTRAARLPPAITHRSLLPP